MNERLLPSRPFLSNVHSSSILYSTRPSCRQANVARARSISSSGKLKALLKLLSDNAAVRKIVARMNRRRSFSLSLDKTGRSPNTPIVCQVVPARRLPVSSRHSRPGPQFPPPAPYPAIHSLAPSACLRTFVELEAGLYPAASTLGQSLAERME